MERAGTGGALFRNIYRDFLKESYDLLGFEAIAEAHEDFQTIANHWTNVADLLRQAGETENVMFINQAAEILKQLSESEYVAMEKLKNID